MRPALSLLSSWQSLAKPRVFSKLAEDILPLSFGLMVLFFGGGLYMSLVASPADCQQGELVRIMYIHVPAAWMSLLLYAVMGAMAFVTLVWRLPLAHLIAQSIAPLGALLTFLSLMTGALWGKPTWGTFWVWDARLTSTFLLFLTYLSTILVQKVWGTKAASYVTLLGLINLPLIKGSVTWWNTLHQPATVSKFSSPSLPSSMLPPLLLMALAYAFYSLSLVLLRIQTHLNHQKQRRS